MGAQALAAEIAALAPLSVRGHKTVLNRVDAVSTLSDEELGVLAEHELAAFQSQDLQEGLAAFSEKRRPRFAGS
jgi:enoyl-CoA hydratase